MHARVRCERRLAAAWEVGGNWRKLTWGWLEACKWTVACMGKASGVVGSYQTCTGVSMTCVGEGDGTCGMLEGWCKLAGNKLTCVEEK